METDQRNYYYSMEWRDTLVDSSTFYIRYGHENPKQFPIESRVQTADHIHIGQFESGPSIKAKLNDFIEITSDTRPDDPAIKLHAGLYYHCNDVFNPELGDVRIQFSLAGLEGTAVSFDIFLLSN